VPDTAPAPPALSVITGFASYATDTTLGLYHAAVMTPLAFPATLWRLLYGTTAGERHDR
jgi:hypothetical protein